MADLQGHDGRRAAGVGRAGRVHAPGRPVRRLRRGRPLGHRAARRPSGRTSSTTTTSTTATCWPPRACWRRTTRPWPTKLAPVMNLLGAGHRRGEAVGRAAAAAVVRPVRRPLVGVGHVAVRGRQQPGVVVGGGQRLERARPVGGRVRPAGARDRGHLARVDRGRDRPDVLDGAGPRAVRRASTTPWCRSTGAASGTTPRGSARSRTRSSASSSSRWARCRRTSRAGVDPEQIRASVDGGDAGRVRRAVRRLPADVPRPWPAPDDAAAAWTEATSLPDTSIDDGSSRSAMLAFIASAQAHPTGG